MHLRLCEIFTLSSGSLSRPHTECEVCVRVEYRAAMCRVAVCAASCVACAAVYDVFPSLFLLFSTHGLTLLRSRRTCGEKTETADVSQTIWKNRFHGMNFQQCRFHPAMSTPAKQVPKWAEGGRRGEKGRGKMKEFSLSRKAMDGDDDKGKKCSPSAKRRIKRKIQQL